MLGVGTVCGTVTTVGGDGRGLPSGHVQRFEIRITVVTPDSNRMWLVSYTSVNSQCHDSQERALWDSHRRRVLGKGVSPCFS